jgi:hypothetical protein
VGASARFAFQLFWRIPVTDQDSSIGRWTRALSPVVRPLQTSKVFPILTLYRSDVVSAASASVE